MLAAMPSTAEQLLAAFHAQVRLADRDADPAHVVEHDGPVHRSYPPDLAAEGAMVENPEGLGDDPATLVARQRDFFVARGQKVEWKTYSYDEPAGLGPLLEAAGFTREDDEALMLGDARAVAALAPSLGPAFVVREVVSDEDVELIADLHEIVWPGTRAVGLRFGAERRADPDLVHGVLVQAAGGGPALCGGWLRLVEGTEFGGVWGGATRPEFRHRGLYRATVARRADLALERGYRYLRSDSTPFSEPILARAGLLRVATTTPYVLDPR
jgi:GNAT superfamily N-acetyltransferase